MGVVGRVVGKPEVRLLTRHNEEVKELEKVELEGNITVRKVRLVERLNPPYVLMRDRPFWLVTLAWPSGPHIPGVSFNSSSPGSDPGGVVEARIYAPRPEDGPGGESWLVTDAPQLQGNFSTEYDTFEQARDSTVEQLRQWDVRRRLTGRHQGA